MDHETEDYGYYEYPNIEGYGPLFFVHSSAHGNSL